MSRPDRNLVRLRRELDDAKRAGNRAAMVACMERYNRALAAIYDKALAS